jgi:hypothetical protein
VTAGPTVRRIGRQLLVALAAVHVFAITLAALPSPSGGLRRADWAQPTVQGEFDAWAGRLSAVGLSITSEALQDHLFDFAVAYGTAHDQALEPFRTYFQLCGTTQSWKMFIAPHRYPAKLQIIVVDGGERRVVFEERHREARWMERQLSHDRFRSAIFRYGWGTKYPDAWKGFTEWIGRRAEADFPAATKVEVRFLSYRTPSPEEVRAGVVPDTRVSRRRVIQLGSLR